MKTKLCKEFKIGKVNVVIETFRPQNKFLPLPHKLFRNGIHYYKHENNKFLSIVISNFRIMFIKKNNG